VFIFNLFSLKGEEKFRLSDELFGFEFGDEQLFINLIMIDLSGCFFELCFQFHGAGSGKDIAFGFESLFFEANQRITTFGFGHILRR
jgi:hypothetical protein